MPTNEFNLDMKLSIDLCYATLYIMYKTRKKSPTQCFTNNTKRT